jgi:DNA invertase Pin-like site-specific DNA recombinase
MTKRVAFYLRGSTGEQTTENQRSELEAAARQRGCGRTQTAWWDGETSN